MREKKSKALRDKVMEEAQEVAEAEPEKLVKELADLYEVMDALMDTYQIDRAAVVREQEHRRRERGGFRQRIRLLRVWAIFP
jgi:phosphoribosyl-ATP pyrophosphohydrolase